MTYYVTPYRRMAAMRHAMNRWFEDPGAEHEMSLAIDVKSTGEAYDITALVPGLTAEDVDIEILDNAVTIRGEFKDGDEDSASYLMNELPSGHFSRTIELPAETDASKVEASIKNGVLSLRIPKAEAAKSKTIKINVN